MIILVLFWRKSIHF